MNFPERVLKKIKYVWLYKKSEEVLSTLVSNKRGIVFLMYHSTPVVETNYGYVTHKESFEKHLAFLNRNFNVISLEKAENILLGNGKLNLSKPQVVITFDDGFRDNYEVAYPALQAHQMPFTIFLTSNFIENNNKSFMSWEEVRVLAKNERVTLGAHSKSHANLMCLKDDDKESEILGSKLEIESKIDRNVQYFAYPSGGYDQTCLDLVGKHYVLGFKDRSNGLDDHDPRKIGRISIDARHNDYKAFLIELAQASFLSI